MSTSIECETARIFQNRRVRVGSRVRVRIKHEYGRISDVRAVPRDTVFTVRRIRQVFDGFGSEVRVYGDDSNGQFYVPARKCVKEEP